MIDQTTRENARKRRLYVKCGFQYGPSGHTQTEEKWGYGYAPYWAKDETYYGAKAVVDLEWNAYLKYRCLPKDADEDQAKKKRANLTGLALSGGGIRSASFSMGVMQAFAKAGWFKKIDYLSTVSGGGYIGSSLTWLLHKTWEVPADEKESSQKNADAKEQKNLGMQASPDSVTFGIDWENFPFRTYPIAEGRSSRKKVEPLPKEVEPLPKNVYAGRILRYLRQHARYLTPGGGLDWVSLTTVILRNSAFSLVVYGSILALLFFMMHWASLLSGLDIVPDPCSKLELKGCFSSTDRPGSTLFRAAGFVLIFWAFVAVLYAFSTICYGKDWFRGSGKHTNYAWRYWHEKLWGRWPLIIALMLAVLGSTPTAYHWLGNLGNKPQTQAFSIKGTPSKAGEWAIEGTIKLPLKQNSAKDTGVWKAIFENLGWLAGVLSTLSGVVMSLFAFKQTSAVKPGKIPMGLVVGVGSVALIFGVLLLAYHVYYWAGWRIPIPLFVFAVVVIALMARFADINQMSLHRYYRDRLMETFLPNVKDALDVLGTVPGGAKMHDSDGTKLYQMCQASMACQETESKQPMGPYHIINTNIVLVSSYIPKFRGRGGDNFILTPLCCGSNATGWCETGRKSDTAHSGQHDSQTKAAESPFESLTFATAMAISGAAVNPNTGSGGQGITRQPLLSFLMGILNIRLGYWAPNPSPRSECLRRIEAIEKKRIPWGWWRSIRFGAYQFITSSVFGKENAISPGMGELFVRRYLDENSHNIQLSDGGHFENLGLYELVRRRLKVIIVCDGAEDLDFTFSCLANAIEKVRADFGAMIDIDAADLEPLIPRRRKNADTGNVGAEDLAFSPRGYLIVPIKYAKEEGDKEPMVGTLIYLTTAFLQSHTADLYAYKKAHPEFPDQPTSDQFFDESQFESYRELGFQIAHRLMCDADVLANHDVENIFGIPKISCPGKWSRQT